MNAVSDGSWDFHDYYDDSWDYGWDDSWDWYSYSDPLWESQEPAGSGTKGTLEQPSGSPSSSPLLQKERRRQRSHHPWQMLHFLQL